MSEQVVWCHVCAQPSGAVAQRQLSHYVLCQKKTVGTCPKAWELQRYTKVTVCQGIETHECSRNLYQVVSSVKCKHHSTMSKSFQTSYTETYQIKARGLKFPARKQKDACVGLAQGFSKQTGKSRGRISAKQHTGMGWRSNAAQNISRPFPTILNWSPGPEGPRVHQSLRWFLGAARAAPPKREDLEQTPIEPLEVFGKEQIKDIIRNQRYSVRLVRLLQNWNTKYKPYMLSGQELWEVLRG